MEKRSVYHIPVMVNDINETRAFYERSLGLLHSGTVGLREDILNVMGNEAICFMSCGDLHHDFAGFQAFDSNWETRSVTPDEILHISFALRPEHTLEEFKDRLRQNEIPFTEGCPIPDPTETYTAANSVYFRDPNGHFVHIHAQAE